MLRINTVSISDLNYDGGDCSEHSLVTEREKVFLTNEWISDHGSPSKSWSKLTRTSDCSWIILSYLATSCWPMALRNRVLHSEWNGPSCKSMKFQSRPTLKAIEVSVTENKIAPISLTRVSRSDSQIYRNIYSLAFPTAPSQCPSCW